MKETETADARARWINCTSAATVDELKNSRFSKCISTLAFHAFARESTAVNIGERCSSGRRAALRPCQARRTTLADGALWKMRRPSTSNSREPAGYAVGDSGVVVCIGATGHFATR